MVYKNIAGYKFIALSQLTVWRTQLQNVCQHHDLKGTILLSEEGINISLAGMTSAMIAFRDFLSQQREFADMRFHETDSSQQPFKRLKIKLKKEIITLRQPEVRVTESRAPAISPQRLKTWLDEKRDITLLDTRNDYEVQLGSFKQALHMNLQHFVEFKDKADQIDRNKPIVMFCTGGVRCEKAALHMMNQGYEEVYQLDGGILGYFAQIGSDHYEGACFVFDERVAVKPN